MINYLENLILDNWNKWVNTVKPEKLDFLKIHVWHATRNKKVGFFVFAKNEPIIFAKTIRESQHNKIIEDGFGRLKNIYKKINDGSVPRPLYLGDYQGATFSLETAIIGKQFHSCKKQKDLEKFLKWFFKFQRLMKQKKKLNIDSFVKKFLDLYESEKNLRELIKELVSGLKRDIGVLSLPSIIQHGDLTPDNVINDRGETKVIDWDNFGKIDLPLFDLLVFLQRWSGIRDVSFIREYSAIIKKYLEEFDIDKRALKSLVFCYYLLDFLRKKEILTDYDKKYLEARLKEIKKYD